MNQTIVARSVTLAGLLLALPLHAETGVEDDAVRLGMVNVQSGPAAALGSGMLVGTSAVFDQVNARGGIHGRQIDLLVADDGYEPEQAIDATLAMIVDEQVFALFGYVGTPSADAVLPIVQELEVPLIGLFTGAGSLRQPVTPQVFNVRSSYDEEAEVMVAHLLDKGARNVAVFYQNDVFGKSVLSGIERALDRRSMDVRAKGTFQRNTLAVKSALANMLAADPDAIVMVGTYAPLAEFVIQARAAGLDSQLATVSSVGPENLVSAVGMAGNGMLITQVMPDPSNDALAVVEECRQLVIEHGGVSLDYVNLEGCVTAMVMVEGLKAAGRDLTREGLISAMESIRVRDLGGIAISFSAEDHQATTSVFITEIRDGELVQLGGARKLSDAD